MRRPDDSMRGETPLRSQTRENYVFPPRCAWAPPFLVPSRESPHACYRQALFYPLIYSLMLLILGIGGAGCRGCGCQGSGVTEIDSGTVTLNLPQVREPAPEPIPPPRAAMAPPVSPPETPARIDIVGRPGAGEQPASNVIENLTNSGPPPVPPSTFKADDLTMRLREKMAQAYGGDVNRVPAANIYLSNGTLDEFIDFYEQRGYKVSRISVPVKRILQPVLREKPELAEKIQLENYEGLVIHQAMVDGTGISAADKYIDPDTYQIIERLFVTEMPLK